MKAQNVDSRAETRPARKDYSPPRLVRYGLVRDIVKGGAGHGTDGGSAGKSKMCWIAEALYGVEAPQTLLVRAWLRQASSEHRGWRLFSHIYTLVGQQTAALIRAGYLPKATFLPLFNSLTAKAAGSYARRLRG